MKKISKSIIIFMLMAVLLLSSCQKTSDTKETSETKETSDTKETSAKTEDKKDNDIDNGNGDETDNDDSGKTISKAKETLKYVKGAIYGSASSYVEDREIWTDFVDEKHIEAVSGEGPGMHLPRILLDTDDAKKANKDIDKIEKDIKGLYNRCKKEITDEVGIYASFCVYQDESVLSLMVESYNFWESKNPSYYVYNFSLPDGTYITDAELMKHFGVDKDEILGLIESSLKDEHELEHKLYYMNVFDSSILNAPRSYTGVALNNLWDSYDPDAHHIYIDEVGEPHYIFKKVEFDSPLIADLKLKSNKLSENPISPEYIKMARKLGIDPEDDKYKALIINLGATFDENTMTHYKIHT